MVKFSKNLEKVYIPNYLEYLLPTVYCKDDDELRICLKKQESGELVLPDETDSSRVFYKSIDFYNPPTVINPDNKVEEDKFVFQDEMCIKDILDLLKNDERVLYLDIVSKPILYNTSDKDTNEILKNGIISVDDIPDIRVQEMIMLSLLVKPDITYSDLGEVEDIFNIKLLNTYKSLLLSMFETYIVKPNSVSNYLIKIPNVNNYNNRLIPVVDKIGSFVDYGVALIDIPKNNIKYRIDKNLELHKLEIKTITPEEKESEK